MKLEFSRQILKNIPAYNFMKIRSVGADFFHADSRMDRHDEANSRYSQLRRRLNWQEAHFSISLREKKLLFSPKDPDIAGAN
jgi:hypothetical protein